MTVISIPRLTVIDLIAKLRTAATRFFEQIGFSGYSNEESRYMLSIPAEVHAEFVVIAERKGVEPVEVYRRAIKLAMVMDVLSQRPDTRIIFEESGEQQELDLS